MGSNLNIILLTKMRSCSKSTGIKLLFKDERKIKTVKFYWRMSKIWIRLFLLQTRSKLLISSGDFIDILMSCLNIQQPFSFKRLKKILLFLFMPMKDVQLCFIIYNSVYVLKNHLPINHVQFGHGQTTLLDHFITSQAFL